MLSFNTIFLFLCLFPLNLLVLSSNLFHLLNRVVVTLVARALGFIVTGGLVVVEAFPHAAEKCLL